MKMTNVEIAKEMTKRCSWLEFDKVLADIDNGRTEENERTENINRKMLKDILENLKQKFDN
jgi:hypothetical protein